MDLQVLVLVTSEFSVEKLLLALAVSTVPILMGVGRALRRRFTNWTLDDVSKEPALRSSLGWIRGAVAHRMREGARRVWLQRTARNVYLRALAARHDRLRLVGGIELPIDRGYIPIDLRLGQADDHRQVVTSPGNYLLLGDPGSGKSAYLSHVVSRVCGASLSDRRHGRLPVTVTLSRLLSHMPADGTGSAFDALENWFQEDELRPANLFETRQMLASYANNVDSGLVVLVDGLDEIDASQYEVGQQVLFSLADNLERMRGTNTLIVAARQQVLEYMAELEIAAGRFRVVRLEPFSDAAMYSFIASWMFASSGSVSPGATSDAFAVLRRNRGLLDTCRNPLALALYLERFFRSRSQDSIERGLAVETRAGFFTEIVNYLLVVRPAQQLFTELPTSAIQRERLNFFTRVAADHVASADAYNDIDSRTVLTYSQLLAGEDGDAESVAHGLAIETGILQSVDGRWRFIHSSFLDYFFALTLATAFATPRQRRDVFNHLGSRRRARFEEAFLLACGLMAARSQDTHANLLQSLGANARLAHLYPRACLESATYTVPGFAKAIAEQCESWKEQWRSEALFPDSRRLPDLIAVLIEYEDLCFQLGRPPEITLQEALGEVVEGSPATLLDVARLNASRAFTLQPGQSVASLLEQAFADEAIDALMDTRILAAVTDDQLQDSKHLSALVAETALRSGWVARELSPEQVPRTEAARDTASVGWAGSWIVRGTRYGTVIENGLQYLEHAGDDAAQDFPRLVLLSRAKPFMRLRNEILFASPRRTYAATCVAVGLGGGAAAAASSAVAGIVAAAVVVTLFVLGARHRIMTGGWMLESMRILNRHPSVGEVFEPGHGTSLVMVRGTTQGARRTFRAPPTGYGAPVAAYWRGFLPWWHRFAPKLDDRRLPVSPCASLMAMPTNDIRKLVNS